MPSAEARIGEAVLEDELSIVGLSDALFREDAGSRDPTTNMEWVMHRVVQAGAVPVTGCRSSWSVSATGRAPNPRGRWAA